MDAKKSGGPAFPVKLVMGRYPGGGMATEDCAGMSLRDYFAAKALQGLTSDAVTLEATRAVAERHGMSDESSIAATAYQLADAMLAERAK